MGTHNENLSLKFKIRGSTMHIFLIQQHEYSHVHICILQRVAKVVATCGDGQDSATCTGCNTSYSIHSTPRLEDNCKYTDKSAIHFNHF